VRGADKSGAGGFYQWGIDAEDGAFGEEPGDRGHFGLAGLGDTRGWTRG